MRTPAIGFLAIVVAILSFVSSEAAYAQAKPSSSGATASKPPSGKTPSAKEEESLAVQRERLEMDKQKFASDRATEKEKLDLERSKLKVEQSKVLWSALSTIVPLLGVLLTVVYSMWSFKKQTALQIAAQNEAAKLDFEIKAAEITFAGKSPQAVRNRGNALKAMFGGRLPGRFLEGFDPKTYGGDKEAPEDKKFFLELLLKYPDKKTEIVKYWDQLFPGDHQWIERVTLEGGASGHREGGSQQ